MPAPDLSVIVPPLAQARGLKPNSTNDARFQSWVAPDGAAISVIAGRPNLDGVPDGYTMLLSMPHTSPAYVGLVELVSEIRLAIGDAS